MEEKKIGGGRGRARKGKREEKINSSSVMKTKRTNRKE